MDFSLVKSYLYISPEGASQPVYELDAERLLQPESALSALQASRQHVRGTSYELPASFIGLTLNNLLKTMLFFAAQDQRLPDFSLHHLAFQIERNGEYAQHGYRIAKLSWTDLPEADRDQALRSHFASFIRNAMAPAIDSVASAAGLKPDLIWNQYASQTAAMKGYMFRQTNDSGVIERFDQAYAILRELPPETFGRKRNPYVHKPRYVDSPYQPGGQVMIRSSCCMYYCREDGKKCYNCPKLRPEERAEMFDAIAAARQNA